MKFNKFLIAVLVACAVLAPGIPGTGRALDAHSKADGSKPTIIRYASLAPNGSPFFTVLKAWGRTLEKQTEGRVKLQLYSGGSQGDESLIVKKINAGQLEGAGVTTVGLASVVRSVLVLGAPGLIVDYPELVAVREGMSARFDKLFLDAGYKLLVWGDGGKNRIFSTRAINSPSDLKSSRPWAWKDDPVYSEFIRVTGANATAMGVLEVRESIETGMIDTVPSSALAAVAMQWYTKLKYVSKHNINIIIGGTIIKRSTFDALSVADQKVLIDTSEKAGRALDKLVVRDDAKSLDLLIKGGMKVLDGTFVGPQWKKVQDDTTNNMIGRIYSKQLLDEVRKSAASAKR